MAELVRRYETSTTSKLNLLNMERPPGWLRCSRAAIRGERDPQLLATIGLDERMLDNESEARRLLGHYFGFPLSSAARRRFLRRRSSSAGDNKNSEVSCGGSSST